MGSSTQLLILADHPKVQQLYRYRLCEYGYGVEVAGDIEEAVVLAIVMRPRLIIAEWLLRHGHGVELVHQLRGIGAVNPIPILFLTDGVSLPPSIYRIEGGRIDYLTKPFPFERFQKKIETLVAASAGNRGAARQWAIDRAPVGVPSAELTHTHATHQTGGETAASGRQSVIVPSSRFSLDQEGREVIQELMDSGLLRHRERHPADSHRPIPDQQRTQHSGRLIDQESS